MTFSLQNVAIAVALIAAPSTLWTAFTRYSEWAAKMRGSKAIQFVALLSITALIVLDLTDRLGLFWPSPSEIATRRDALETKVQQQATALDDLREQVKRLQNGPVTVLRPEDCPHGFTVVIDGDIGNNTATGIEMPNGANLCIVRTKIHDNPVGIDVRDK